MTDSPCPHDLTIARFIAAPPEAVFRCWTDPSLIVKWFTPPPYETVSAEVDLRPGGASVIVMRSPEGQEFPNLGVYLEIVPNRRIVSTDAWVRAWEPAAKAFMTLILSFEPEGEGTRYTAIARHWTAEDKASHEAMGFHEGWGVATDQLAALAATV